MIKMVGKLHPKGTPSLKIGFRVSLKIQGCVSVIAAARMQSESGRVGMARVA